MNEDVRIAVRIGVAGIDSSSSKSTTENEGTFFDQSLKVGHNKVHIVFQLEAKERR